MSAEQAPGVCPTPGCDGDARYAAPGRGHRDGCTHPVPAVMRQEAPYPVDLADLVQRFAYRPGWRAYLTDEDRGQGCIGLTFNILANVQDSLADPGDYQPLPVLHLFPVPAAAYNRTSWMRWLLDRCLDVEQHEACEFFKIDGVRVFAPHHSEGEDPYTIWHIGDAETADKSSRDR